MFLPEKCPVDKILKNNPLSVKNKQANVFAEYTDVISVPIDDSKNLLNQEASQVNKRKM